MDTPKPSLETLCADIEAEITRAANLVSDVDGRLELGKQWRDIAFEHALRRMRGDQTKAMDGYFEKLMAFVKTSTAGAGSAGGVPWAPEDEVEVDDDQVSPNFVIVCPDNVLRISAGIATESAAEHLIAQILAAPDRKCYDPACPGGDHKIYAQDSVL